MNIKRKLYIGCALLLLALTVCIYFTYSQIEYPVYHGNFTLDEIRLKIKQELKYGPSTASALLDKVCAIENTTGTCYFNTAIQTLFADSDFMLFFIMNRFSKGQKVCIIFQNIACKLITGRIVNLLDDLVELKKIEDFQRIFHIKGGGNPSYCILKLLQKLDEETLSFNLPGSPSNFFVSENLSFVCSDCKTKNQVKGKRVSFTVRFSNNLLDSFNSYFKERKSILNKFENLQCAKCKVYGVREVKHGCIFPSYLMIENGRVDCKNQNIVKLDGKMDYCLSFEIEKVIYALYAVICIHGDLDNLHVNVVVKRKDKWYLLNDEIVSETKIEDNSWIKESSWVFLYKRIKGN